MPIRKKSGNILYAPRIINFLSGHMPDHIQDGIIERMLHPLSKLMCFYPVIEKYALKCVFINYTFWLVGLLGFMAYQPLQVI